MCAPEPQPLRTAQAGAAALTLALLAAVAAPARAADPTPSPVQAPEPVRAILELYVNTVDEGVANVAFAGKEILVATEDLTAAGLVLTGAQRQTTAGKEYVKLSSLAPGVSFAYDDQALALRLTVDPNLLTSNEVNLQAARAPKDIIRGGAPSAFLNYSVTGTTATQPTLFAEQGISLFGGLFDNSLTETPSQAPMRGNTSITIDNQDNLTRTTVGDIVASTGTLGGAIELGGVGYSKNFAIDPYFVPSPTQRFSGIVNTPSTADVYVNGQLVRTVNLPPGPFNLLDIPGVNGAGVTSVVIRNAFGQQQTLGSSFYQSTTVLRQGLSQYSYNAGFVRNEGNTSPLGAYDLPAFSATHNYGLTDQLTIGGFFQADPQLEVGGPQATLVLPVGQFTASAAPSSAGGETGWSGLLGYSYQNPTYNFGVTGSYMSTRFANLSLTPADDRARWQGTAFAAVQLGDWNGLLQLTPAVYRDTGHNDQATVTISRHITDALSLIFTAGQSRVEGQPVDTSVFLGFTLSLGTNTVASASVSHSNEGYASTAQVSRSLPIGPGYGYLAQVQSGSDANDVADLQYQTTFGTYEADASRLQGQNTLRYSASGALVAIGGDIKPTVALRDAYALIRVPDAKGVTGYLSNQEVGTTDSNGDLIVPNLLSYYGNHVEINEQDIPFDYRVDATELVVAPPYRSGAVVQFPVYRFQAFTGTMRVKTETATEIPSYGELTLEAAGKTYRSPVGKSGEFYFESLPPGIYAGTVQFDVRQCQFSLAVPKSLERTVKLGEITCATP